MWAALYAVVTRAVAAYLCRGRAGAAAYVARSLAVDDAVYGISDIDLVVVAPGDRRRRGNESERLRRRWQRLRRAVPPLGGLLPDVAFYEDEELAEATAGSVLTYGLDREGRAPADRPAFRGSAPLDEFGLRSRPGVYGPLRDWRLVRGPDRRPPLAPLSAQDRRIAAWQELQFWWSFAFELASAPARPWSASLCVKLVAEPARAWLALVDGAMIGRRRDVLRRALVRLPEEEDAIRRALELHDRLGLSPPAPLAESLPAFVRLTARLAARLREELEDEAWAPVRLYRGASDRLALPAGDGGSAAFDREPAELLPLVDWRALANPGLPDDAFRIVAGDPGSAEDLARAAKSARNGAYAALRADRLLVLPALGVWSRSYLRAVQCQPTDPVSFALAAGSDVARFPEVRGWRASDWARRAVAEHRAELWERQGPGPRRPHWPEVDAAPPPLRALAKLLTAARAGLFLERIEEGDPELALTAAAVAGRLSDRAPAAGAVAEAAVEGYRTALAGGPLPAERTVAAFRELVATLPGYAETR